MEVIGKTELVFSLEELGGVAKQLIKAAGPLKVWIFEGNMGAGKTTLIKEIARQLGVKAIVQSPTFSIVNQYSYIDGEIFHFDFYRVKTEEEAFDIGVDEYFDSGSFSFVEWPDRIPSLLPQQFFEIVLTTVENDLRQLVYRRHE